MPFLRRGAQTHLRRSGHVAALRDLPVTPGPQPGRGLLSPSRLCLRAVLPGPAGRIRERREYLRGLPILLVLLRLLAETCRELLRQDDREARPEQPELRG